MNAALLERPSHASSHVLIVDGDAKAAECLAMLLRLSDPDITTTWVQTGHAASTIASELRPQVAIIVVGDEPTRAASVAGDVLSHCSGARPLMIALAAPPSAPGLERLFDHVLPRPFELPNLVSLVTRRRTAMQLG
jgi:DNA-binding response OmpR family regulator